MVGVGERDVVVVCKEDVGVVGERAAVSVHEVSVGEEDGGDVPR